ncbi:hypothetical protein K3495_g14307 [Podosphaera aphanis]|nr:hypothetical protein K3495_g14307 [Podosphaera aphanis]
MPRRTSLTNSQRRAIIDHQKQHSGISQKALIQWAEEAFDLTVSQTTILRLLADSKRISQRGLVDGCKRNRAVKYPLVEKALKEWFEIYQGRIPITGDIIKTKAACFMTALYPDQEPSKEIASGWSNGWIARFKTRHNIKEYKTHGERGSADFSSIERLRSDIRDMLSNYAPADVYNMDETRLFYRAQQDRSLATQLLIGRKSDKERLSIVICTNENGTDKLPLWFVGSAKQPRDHRRNHGGNIEQYGIKWRANKKSWMTTILFQEWLLWFEERMRNNNRSVLLLDNCSAHKIGELELRHTKVYFLPPNTTSVIQPCDAGIIRTFKEYYR